MAAVPRNLTDHRTHVVLDLGCARSIGSMAAIERFQRHARCCGITTEFFRCKKSFVFANSERETCWASCIIHFPTTPPRSTRVDVLETGDQMQNLGMTIELDPKGDNITCPAFGLYSSPAEYSIMVLDLTSLAFQPKSRERSGHPRRHVTFAIPEQTLAYPAQTRDLEEDEDDEPLCASRSHRCLDARNPHCQEC